MERIDIKIGFDCNNRCDFCAQGHKRKNIPRKSLKEIRKILSGARAKGLNEVVFTGGEPTLHPELLSAVREAKAFGFERIQVQSNGRRFAYPEYCAELRRAGVTQCVSALHGSTPAVHDTLTNAPGSFKEVVAGIKNCVSLGFEVLTNSVVTAHNMKDLPDLAKLLVHLKVDQFQLAFVHIIGTAWEKRRKIVPRKKTALVYMKKALDVGRAAGVKCYTEAIPFCLMNGYEECVAERIIPEGPVADADVYVENYGDYRRGEGKIKRAECGGCKWFSECEGPWREYPQMYGWDEFVPVKK